MEPASFQPLYQIDGRPREDRLRFMQEVVPKLRKCGLKVAVVRVQNGIGQESAALQESNCYFMLEADVFVSGVRTVSLQNTYQEDEVSLRLARLTRRYDIVLVDGCLEPALKTIWLGQTADDAELSCRDGHLFVGEYRGDQTPFVQALVEQLQDYLWRSPVWACILIGGKSSRMGRPKHLLPAADGGTWLEKTVATVRPHVDGVVLSGQGRVPDSLSWLPRIPDLPGIAGPLTGILSAMRWQPDVSWVLLACDMPELSEAALEWLLAKREPGSWAAVPRQQGEERVEPLLAWYDVRCAPLFEALAASGSLRIGRVAHCEKVNIPEIPEHLQGSWRNVNSPGEL